MLNWVTTDSEPLHTIDEDEIYDERPDFIESLSAPSKDFIPMKLHTPEEYTDQGYVMLDIAGATTNHSGITINQQKLKVLKQSPFIEKGTDLFYKTKNGEDILLANFTVRFDRIVHEHTLHGVREYYGLILYKDAEKLPLTINTARYLNLADVLNKNDHSDFRIEPSIEKSQTLFRSYLSHIFEEAKRNQTLRVVDSYDYAGWQECSDGQMHFYSALDEACSSKQALVPLRDLSSEEVRKAVMWLFELRKYGEPTIMIPMFLYKFVGVLAAPFQKAMRPINFILDICGPTGIGKTSVAQPFFNDFDPELSMVNFTATPSGIDRFIESKHDSITLLDDLSTILDCESRRTLERVLRQFCDSNGRVTAARDGGYNRIEMRGGIVLTSETPLEGSRQSSMLRLLVLPATPNSFDPNLVPLLRTDMVQRRTEGGYSKMDIAMTAFIDYVTTNYEKIVYTAASYKTDAAPMKFRRLQTTYELLQLIAQVVFGFGQQYGVFSADECIHFPEKLKNALLPIITYNTLLGQQADPMMLFLSTIVPAIDQKLLRIAPTKNVFAGQTATYMGYFETEDGCKKLKVDPYRIYEWVVQSFRKSNFRFSATLQEILKKLNDAKLSEGYAQKGHAAKTLKQVTINGEKLSLLVLLWDDVRMATDHNM